MADSSNESVPKYLNEMNESNDVNYSLKLTNLKLDRKKVISRLVSNFEGKFSSK